jgi:adenosylcobinamide kinase/adenosylcobinamide-phosphate guanylyltransferase
MRTLILGGARSGKSRYAEQCARDSGLEVVYIATAEAGDAEMARRIAEHRARRPPSWGLIEEPLALARVLADNAAPTRCLVVDCLTLWLSNLLAEEGLLKTERAALLDVLPTLPGEIYLISNEVGQGIVPANALARRFVDEAGWLHQDLARICERVLWITAGLPQILKDKHGTMENP